MASAPGPAAPTCLATEHPLTTKMIGFVDHLRLNGFILGPPETQSALAMMRHTSGDINADRQSLKTLLTSRREEWDGFDGLFEAYWSQRGKMHHQWQKSESMVRTTSKLPRAWQDHLDEQGGSNSKYAPQIEEEGQDQTDGQASGRLVASDNRALEKTDFRRFVNAAEIAESEALACKLARAIRYRQSRRQRIAKNGTRLDLRRTIRANMHHGGEPIDLRFKSVPDHPVRIVVFLDVSGSMKHYSRFFLHFVRGLVCQWAQTDAYLFHTKLIRVTDTLRHKDSMKAMTNLTLMADGFGGGTRIGDCLDHFNDQYAKKAINSRSVVVILSDGYDVGPAEKMATELKRLKKRAKRLVWLNPLIGWKEYMPVTTAMEAAMPYIDLFAAANTLEALSALEPEFAQL